MTPEKKLIMGQNVALEVFSDQDKAMPLNMIDSIVLQLSITFLVLLIIRE